MCNVKNLILSFEKSFIEKKNRLKSVKSREEKMQIKSENEMNASCSSLKVTKIL